METMSVRLDSISARGVDYIDSVFLSLGRPLDGVAPDEIWSQRLEVWRKPKSFPVRGDQGAVRVLVDHTALGPTDPIPDYEDAVGSPGTEFYYAVYLEDSEGTWWHDPAFDRVHGFSWPSAFAHTDYVYQHGVAPVDRKKDADDLVLYRLLQLLIGEPSDSFKTFAEKLGQFHSIDEIPGTLLLELDRLLGWPTAAHRSLLFQREETRSIRYLMRLKGSKAASEAALLNVSDMNAEMAEGFRYAFFLNQSPTIVDSPGLQANLDLITDGLTYTPDVTRWQRIHGWGAFLSPIPDVSHGIDALFFKDLERLFGTSNESSQGGSLLLPSSLDMKVSVQSWGPLFPIPVVPYPPVQNSVVGGSENFDAFVVGDLGGQGFWITNFIVYGGLVIPGAVFVTAAQAYSVTQSIGGVAALLNYLNAIYTALPTGYRYQVLEFRLYIPSGQTEDATTPPAILNGITVDLIPIGGPPQDVNYFTPNRVIWGLDANGDPGVWQTPLLPTDYDTWLYVKVVYDSKMGTKNCYFRSADGLQYANVPATTNFQTGAVPWTEGVGTGVLIQIIGGLVETFEAYVDDVVWTGVN